MIVVTV